MKEGDSLTRFCFGRTTPSAEDPRPGEPSVYTKDDDLDVRLYSDGRFDLLIVDTARHQRPSEVKERIAAHASHPYLRAFFTEESRSLRRIFQKDPQDEHQVRNLTDIQRRVATLEIKNDPALLREYIDVHRPDNMWPQVLANMDTMGVRDMELYLMGYQAFLVTTVAADVDIEQEGTRWSELPREREWQQYVAKYQKVDAQSSVTEKWKLLKRVV